MIWTDATHPITGEIVPRCESRVAQDDIARNPALAPGEGWECGLPAGHENWSDTMTVERDDGHGNIVIDNFDLTRFHPHSWSFTGEV